MNAELLERIRMTVDRRDNSWLQLPICPDFKRTGKCVQPAGSLCIYAHPDPENKNLLILNGEVVVSCFQNVYRTCTYANCKYYHPPDHLKNVVKTNGKNNLRIRNEVKQTLGTLPSSQNVVPTVAYTLDGTNLGSGGTPYYLTPYQYNHVPCLKTVFPTVEPSLATETSLSYTSPTTTTTKEVTGKASPRPTTLIQLNGEPIDYAGNPPAQAHYETELTPPGEPPVGRKSRAITPDRGCVQPGPAPKRTPSPGHLGLGYTNKRPITNQDLIGQVYPTASDMIPLSVVYPSSALPLTAQPQYPWIPPYGLGYSYAGGNLSYLPQVPQQAAFLQNQASVGSSLMPHLQAVSQPHASSSLSAQQLAAAALQYSQQFSDSHLRS